MIEIARHYGNGPVKRREIARAQGLTQGYLEIILGSLRDSGYITTVRGAGGGFVLERPPSQITLLDMVTALEGSMAPVECVENPGLCDRAAGCAARAAWCILHEAQRSALGSITLERLVDMEMQGRPLNFSI
jgi:Rrf2 family cysteine metabolism transcriptional repressor